MAKIKFRFNPETLSYEKIELSLKQRLKKGSKNFVIISIIAIGLISVASFFVESPNITRLRSQQQDMLLKYQMINKTLDNYGNQLSGIAYNDDNLYRVYFESDPVSPSIRNSGSGGSNRYESLQVSKYADILIGTTQRVDQITKQLLVQSSSFDEVADMAMNKEKVLSARPAIQPISINELTRFGSSFGMRYHPILHINRMHKGIDLTAPRGTKIFASADGKVVEAGYTTGGYGRKIVLDHGYGYQSLYGHCYKILVKVGQEVKRGDVIGLVGSTGLSTNPHLHYEVHHNGRAVDPVNYYANDLTAEEYDKMINMLANSDPNFDINFQ